MTRQRATVYLTARGKNHCWNFLGVTLPYKRRTVTICSAISYRKGKVRMVWIIKIATGANFVGSRRHDSMISVPDKHLWKLAPWIDMLTCWLSEKTHVYWPLCKGSVDMTPPASEIYLGHSCMSTEFCTPYIEKSSWWWVSLLSFLLDTLSPVITTNNIGWADFACWGAGRHGCTSTVCSIHTFHYCFVNLSQLLFYVYFLFCFN